MKYINKLSIYVILFWFITIKNESQPQIWNPVITDTIFILLSLIDYLISDIYVFQVANYES